jgi:hypothetical protein
MQCDGGRGSMGRRGTIVQEGMGVYHGLDFGTISISGRANNLRFTASRFERSRTSEYACLLVAMPILNMALLAMLIVAHQRLHFACQEIGSAWRPTITALESCMTNTDHNLGTALGTIERERMVVV